MANGLAAPVVLKPVRQGSSVGLQFVERVEDWSAALAEALRYDSEVLLEEKFWAGDHRGYLGREALPIVEVRPRQVATITNKYTSGRRNISARIVHGRRRSESNRRRSTRFARWAVATTVVSM